MPDCLIVDNATVLTEQSESSVLVSSEDHVIVVTSAVQGPMGPPGLPGASGTGQTTVTAATNVGGHRAVVMTAGGVSHADNLSLSHSGRVAGITTGAALAGASSVIQSSGRLVEGSWNWTPMQDIWLGVDGVLVQTYPTTAVFVQRLGYAVSSTEMWIEIDMPVVH